MTPFTKYIEELHKLKLDSKTHLNLVELGCTLAIESADKAYQQANKIITKNLSK